MVGCGEMVGIRRRCSVAEQRTRPCRVVVGDPSADELASVIVRGLIYQAKHDREHAMANFYAALRIPPKATDDAWMRGEIVLAQTEARKELAALGKEQATPQTPQASAPTCPENKPPSPTAPSSQATGAKSTALHFGTISAPPSQATAKAKPTALHPYISARSRPTRSGDPGLKLDTSKNAVSTAERRVVGDGPVRRR